MGLAGTGTAYIGHIGHIGHIGYIGYTRERHAVTWLFPAMTCPLPDCYAVDTRGACDSGIASGTATRIASQKSSSWAEMTLREAATESSVAMITGST